jgi:acyl-ACP thioesterase
METVRVRSTNLDYCSHTNNIEYLRFILNTYAARTFEEREISRIEIHYGNQTFEGDEIAVFKHSDMQTEYFSLVSNGKTAVDCMIVWK